jgi:transposase
MAEIAELKRQLFGSRGERLTAEQEEKLKRLKKDMEAQAQRPGPVSEEILEPDNHQKRRPRRSRMRHPIPAHIEVDETIHDPGPGVCNCGRPQCKIGEEVTEEYDLIPARLICRRTRRVKYGSTCGDCGVSIPALAPRLIPQSRLGVGLAVHILLTRYDDHVSFYWLEKQFLERHRVIIARQLMVQWVEHIAGLLEPIYDAMWQVMCAGGYLQIDETPVRVLDPEVKGKARKGYLWFYAVPGGDVILSFDPSRGLKPVTERLKTFSGTIQTDAYDVYLSLSAREPGRLQRIGCLAHVRRRFYKALPESFDQAVWFIDHIRLLYQIEQRTRALPPEERRAIRQAEAPEIWEAMKQRALPLQSSLLPKSKLGEAINYFINEYDALLGYLQDGRFEIDQNLIENAIRPLAVGRRRWLFVGHPDAGWRSAVIYSIISSCRRRGINPQDYLTDVLTRLPTTNINEIAALLPVNWKPATTGATGAEPAK